VQAVDRDSRTRVGKSIFFMVSGGLHAK